MENKKDLRMIFTYGGFFCGSVILQLEGDAVFFEKF